MKKNLNLNNSLIAATLCFVLTACGGSAKSDSATPPGNKGNNGGTSTFKALAGRYSVAAYGCTGQSGDGSASLQTHNGKFSSGAVQEIWEFGPRSVETTTRYSNPTCEVKEIASITKFTDSHLTLTTRDLNCNCATNCPNKADYVNDVIQIDFKLSGSELMLENISEGKYTATQTTYIQALCPGGQKISIRAR